jgi:hypothetical protein
MKKNSLLLPILIIIAGWFLGGWGFTMKGGHPLNTICFLLGIGLLFLGFILFVIRVRNK